jgi:hypothetical protein
MAKSKTVEQTYNASADRTYAAVLRTASEMDYSIGNSDAVSKTVSFNTGMSMKSWAGQDMSVTVFDDGASHSRVVIGGKRAQRGNFGGGGQLFDWGEKKKLAASFLERLDTVVAETPEPAASSPASSAADEIAKLADLHAKGALTDEEFQGAKASLLAGGQLPAVNDSATSTAPDSDSGEAPPVETPSPDDLRRASPPPNRKGGWYPDPFGTGLLRWWGGQSWSEQTRSSAP